MASIDQDGGMKRRQRFSDEIRAAIERSGVSRYALCKRVGLAQSAMSRFMSGEQGLSLAVLDRLAAALDLHVVVGRPRRRKV